jgi:ribosomal protein S18 acetylase RimI-like enzyme
MTGIGTASEIRVRALTGADAEAVATIDARIVGRRRTEFFRAKLREALEESGVRISLAAEQDGTLAGFLLARVYYGEFGVAEPEAVVDTIGVDPDRRGRGVARALLVQVRANLVALGIRRVRTEVDWDDIDLLAFFHAQGFRPSPRFCLEATLDPERSGRREEDEAGPGVAEEFRGPPRLPG